MQKVMYVFSNKTGKSIGIWKLNKVVEQKKCAEVIHPSMSKYSVQGHSCFIEPIPACSGGDGPSCLSLAGIKRRRGNKFTFIFTPTGNLEFPVQLTCMSLDRLFAQHILYVYLWTPAQSRVNKKVPGYWSLLDKFPVSRHCLLAFYFEGYLDRCTSSSFLHHLKCPYCKMTNQQTVANNTFSDL